MPTDSPAVPRARVHRDVVSYVRRSARMNDSQRRAWETHAGRYLVEVPTRETSTSIAEDAHVDWDAAFGRHAPRVVEIGPGRGEALASLAAAHPEVDIVAFEVFEPAVASLMGRLARDGLTNVRVVVGNGAEGLERLFAPASVAELWTFFPDPWHKARHHKRRLVGPAFAGLAASRLADGGRWRLATDWDDYALAMRDVLDAAPGLQNEHAGWAPRWDARPVTKYEQRGLDAGRRVHDLTYRRLPRAAATGADA
ncbi:tRNA (guanosine(46)-N7)-methyltransferase TrmB [Nigerium massiliense]|uniref:tRNA (guanosine(46)-N7)-methyltransferase TrmB n=1 Tax=Nigerium massiliense TaxID=1522317 RepID=UPI00058EA6F4|nr:tRNA (guanosine(46)-N7)-methyltransferase TrmB [Nigerium massiliense]